MTVQCFPRHLRAVKICNSGARRWFVQHNLDWQTFVSSGIPSDVFVATNDPLALKMVGAAEREAADGR